MADLLIRGLSADAVERIDAEASALGLSRNEYLRRELERDASPAAGVELTATDWRRSAEIFQDLSDPAVMDLAWR